jgi:hypothetical protein
MNGIMLQYVHSNMGFGGFHSADLNVNQINY